MFKRSAVDIVPKLQCVSLVDLVRLDAREQLHSHMEPKQAMISYCTSELVLT